MNEATPQEESVLETWQRETDLATPEQYNAYLLDGDTRGVGSLEKLEAAFENIMREAENLEVGEVPAVWSVYNMGYLVKTRESFFSIDLVHRRAAEIAPLLDFALITHNHGDHWRQDFYRAMDRAGKTVVSSFLANYGAANWRSAAPDWAAGGGFTRARKTFRIRDVEVRTSYVDHNDYLVDFTTAFEVRVGKWTLYHTGDCGRGSEPKLRACRPDLWVFFPGCGIDVEAAVRRVRPKRLAFGHLWELGHKSGRLTAPLLRNALAAARRAGADPVLALWGDRLS